MAIIITTLLHHMTLSMSFCSTKKVVLMLQAILLVSLLAIWDLNLSVTDSVTSSFVFTVSMKILRNLKQK